VTSLIYARNTVALEKAVCRRDQRKIPELARDLTDRGSPVAQLLMPAFGTKQTS
jgi:hypothetical protein